MDNREQSTALVKRLELKIPLLADAGMKVIRAYGVAMEGRDIAVPSVFIVGQDRQVLYRHVGKSMMDRPEVEDLLKRVR